MALGMAYASSCFSSSCPLSSSSSSSAVRLTSLASSLATTCTPNSATTAAQKQAASAAAGHVEMAEPAARETPVLHSVTVIDRQRRETLTFSVSEDRYILEAGEDNNLSLPFSCRQGCCTACAVRIRSGEFFQPEALGVAAVLKAKGYGLLCVGHALSDLELESQDEDEVYMIQFGKYFGQGTIAEDKYALDLIMHDKLVA